MNKSNDAPGPYILLSFHIFSGSGGSKRPVPGDSDKSIRLQGKALNN